jgi:hypothetical protein
MSEPALLTMQGPIYLYLCQTPGYIYLVCRTPFKIKESRSMLAQM